MSQRSFAPLFYGLSVHFQLLSTPCRHDAVTFSFPAGSSAGEGLAPSVHAHSQAHYDSTLLAGLENLLVLVPFILISQAALIDPDITWTLCVAGGLLALSRLSALKRWIADLNLPSQTVAAGVLILIDRKSVV